MASVFLRSWRWGVRLVALLLIVDLFYLALTWPDWNRLVGGAIPKSKFISEYQASQIGRASCRERV